MSMNIHTEDFRLGPGKSLAAIQAYRYDEFFVFYFSKIRRRIFVHNHTTLSHQIFQTKTIFHHSVL